jgi:hypothetical protein
MNGLIEYSWNGLGNQAESTKINQSYDLNYFSNEVEEGASKNLHRPFHASTLYLVGFHLGTQSIYGTLTLMQGTFIRFVSNKIK